MPKILFIEDDNSFLSAYSKKFQLEGFEVVPVNSAQLALSIIKEHKPDCIVLDIMLAGNLNGFDILEAIKRDELFKNIPVVVLTNLDSEEKVAKEIGANEYFVKTKTDPEEIVNTIKKLIGK